MTPTAEPVLLSPRVVGVVAESGTGCNSDIAGGVTGSEEHAAFPRRVHGVLVAKNAGVQNEDAVAAPREEKCLG